MRRNGKVTLLASASILGLAAFASPVQAADIYAPQPMAEQVHPLAGISAVLTLWAGAGIPVTDDTDFESVYFNFGGNARVATEHWQFELDAAAHTPSSDESSDHSEYLAFGAHYLMRSPEHTWGVFGAGAVGTHVSSQENSYHVLGGVEYARFMGMNTLFVQLGGIAAVAGDVTSTWQSGGFLRGGWRHFFSPNAKFSVEAMVGIGGFSATEIGHTVAWAAEYERQIAGGPFSWFAAYRGHYVEDSDSAGADGTNHSILLGFRADVGRDNLLDRDRTGAGTFDLPDLHRAISWIDNI
jgi:hypothetical protein